MNSLSRTEFRRLSDIRAQIDLERRIRRHHEAVAERAAKYRRPPTPKQPEPCNFCAPVEPPPAAPTWPAWAGMVALSLVLTAAAWSFPDYLLPLLWRLP